MSPATVSLQGFVLSVPSLHSSRMKWRGRVLDNKISPSLIKLTYWSIITIFPLENHVIASLAYKVDLKEVISGSFSNKISEWYPIWSYFSEFSDANSSIMNFQFKAGIRRKYYVSVLVILCQLLWGWLPWPVHHSGPPLPVEFLLQAPVEDQRVEREGSWSTYDRTYPEITIVPTVAGGTATVHTALSCLQPSPCPIRPRQWQLPAIASPWVPYHSFRFC